jgi:lipopolysaccharide heptosyltransferase II
LLDSILAIKLADVGDVVLVTPALDSLRQAHPEARIDALVTPWSADLLRHTGLVDHLYLLDRHRIDALARRPAPSLLAYALRVLAPLRGRYSAVLLFHHLTTPLGSLKHGLITLSTGAARRVGLDNGRGWWFLNMREQDRGFGAKHEAEYWLSLAALLGADPHSGRLRVGWGAEHHQRARQLLLPLCRRPLVCIAPGTGSFAPARRWPVEGFLQVARWIVGEGGGSVAVVGTATERPLGRHLADHLPPQHCLDLTGLTSLPELAAIISLCDLYIGNDSGATQVALAVGTPTVAIFGPSNVRAWGPFRTDAAQVVRMEGLACSPCLYRSRSVGLRFGCSDRFCLTGLGAERVMAAAEALLK